MRSRHVTRRTGVIVLAVLLLTGAGLIGEPAPLDARAWTTAFPVSPVPRDGALVAMLGRLPDRPLGLDGAMVTYADVAGQVAALGVGAPGVAGDEEGEQPWIAAVMPLTLSQATAQHWALPE